MIIRFVISMFIKNEFDKLFDVPNTLLIFPYFEQLLKDFVCVFSKLVLVDVVCVVTSLH